MIPENVKREYVTTGGNFCPYCESTNITAMHPESEDYGISMTVRCEDCEHEWTEWYTLTGVEDEDDE